MDAGARLAALEAQLAEVLDRLAAIENAAEHSNERDISGTTHVTTERAWHPYQRVPANAHAFGFSRPAAGDSLDL